MATSTACCCSGAATCDACADRCAYFIEIESPSILAITSTAIPCGGSGSRNFVAPTSNVLPLYAPSDLNQNFDIQTSRAVTDSRNSALDTSAGEILLASINYSEDAATNNTKTFRMISDITVILRCNASRPGSPYSVFIEAYSEIGCLSGGQNSQAGKSVTGEYDLGSQCVALIDRQCGSASAFHTLTTPVTLTATGVTTSLGGYTSTVESSNGPRATEMEDIRDSVHDAITGTFKITSRDSCNPLP